MRQFVDDMLASGMTVTVAADVAHRRSSILPLVLAGVADAVLPAGWTDLARRAGADVLAIEPTSHLHVALVHRHGPAHPGRGRIRRRLRTYAQQRGLRRPDPPRPPTAHLPRPGVQVMTGPLRRADLTRRTAQTPSLQR